MGKYKACIGVCASPEGSHKNKIPINDINLKE